MTALDSALLELADRIRSLSTRCIAGLFWACSSALLPEARALAARRGDSNERVLQEALAAAYGFAVFGTIVPAGDQLLLALVESTPHGDSQQGVPSGIAQDCWICADVAVRSFADRTFDPGPAIEYALEPILASTTERLFGVSQLGGGAREEPDTRAIMEDPAVVSAVSFCRWAAGLLAPLESPTAEDLLLVRSRAAILLPGPDDIGAR